MNCIQVFRCSILDLLIKFKHVAALNLIVFEKYNSVCALLIIATMCLNLIWLDYLKGRHLRNCTWVLAFVFFYVNLFIVLIEFRFVIWFQFDVVFIVKNWEYLRHGVAFYFSWETWRSCFFKKLLTFTRYINGITIWDRMWFELRFSRFDIVLKLQFQNLSVRISSLLCQFVDTCFGGIIK